MEESMEMDHKTNFFIEVNQSCGHLKTIIPLRGKTTYQYKFRAMDWVGDSRINGYKQVTNIRGRSFRSSDSGNSFG